jgi:RHS repeat-associated protein
MVMLAETTSALTPRRFCSGGTRQKSAQSSKSVDHQTSAYLHRLRGENLFLIIDQCQLLIGRNADAYGNTLIFTAPDTTGNWWGDAAVQSYYGANEIIYCGYRFDPETELYYVRNRTYSPVLGRWIQRDPIGYQGGVSLYEYVKSMVERNADPSGLMTELPGVQPPVLSKTGKRHPLSDGRYYQNFYYTQALGVVITSGDTPSNQKFFQLAESLLHGLTKLSGVGEILTDMAKSITDNGDYQIPFLGTAFPEVTKVVFCKTGKVQSVTLKEWRNTQWEWDTSLHGQMGGGFVLSGGEDQDREFFKSLLDTLKELVKSAGGK